MSTLSKLSSIEFWVSALIVIVPPLESKNLFAVDILGVSMKVSFVPVSI